MKTPCRIKDYHIISIPLLVACDIYRPAAIEQLEINAKKQNVDAFSMGTKNKPLDIARAGICLLYTSDVYKRQGQDDVAWFMYVQYEWFWKASMG